MRTPFILLFCMLLSAVKGQEKVNTFSVVDTESKLSVPSVSVAIVRAKLAITTEQDGIFSIPGDLGKMKDTLILSAQNYSTMKFALRELDGLDTLYLQKLSLDTVLPKFEEGKDSLLNDFDRKEIYHFAGVHTETSLFEYLQLAQQFDVARSEMVLKSVVINRLAFSYQGNTAGSEVTTFRVRIYGLDSVNGGPGKDLCNHLIEIKDKDSRRFRLNLMQYKIVIPGRKFFVAIEWLRDYRNMGYSTVFNERSRTNVQHVNYRPAIGISPVKGKKTNIWALDFQRKWKPYTYFSPDFTDLAIKATVSY